MPTPARHRNSLSGHISGRSTIYAPEAAVATSQPLATGAGISIMQQGGNAVDAAIAAAGVLSVTEPHMTGPGGDAFAILWSARESRLVGLNASGRSGGTITRTALLQRGHRSMPRRGAESITVPGAVSGWHALLERYGNMEMDAVLQPAIRLAEQGFPVSPIIAREWKAAARRLARDQGAAATFLLDSGKTPGAGEWFRNPDLGSTLREIATDGPGSLYGGKLGEILASHVTRLGGFLTTEDLGGHQAEWVEPISTPFANHYLWELPPPGQGIAALEMLRILAAYDLKGMGHNSAEYLHHLIEAKKLAYADLKAFVSDPTSASINPWDLLSDPFIDARRAKLDPERASHRVAPASRVTAGDTVYLTTADSEGNMVSFINSIFGSFGSGVVVPGTGFALQNRGSGFSLQARHPNVVEPNKRPFHTIIPAFVTRSNSSGITPWLSFGVMGGAMQPQGHIQVLLNLLLFDMDLQQAVDSPRFRHLAGRRVALESQMEQSVRTALESRGHQVTAGSAFGGAQAIMRLHQGWAAASDRRKDGQAAGY